MDSEVRLARSRAGKRGEAEDRGEARLGARTLAMDGRTGTRSFVGSATWEGRDDVRH